MTTASRWFVAILVLICVFYFPLVLDRTLAPRYFLLSGAMTVICIVALFTKERLVLPTRLPVLLYAGFTVFFCCSVGWSHNKAEALVSAGRQVLALFVLLAAVVCYERNRDQFLKVVFAVNHIITAVVLIVILFQLISLRPATRDELYAITAINGHKNLVSSFLFLSLGLFIIQGAELITGKKKIVVGIYCLLIVAALLILRTKAVWVGAGAAAIFMIWFILLPSVRLNKKQRITVLIAVVILANLFWLLFIPGVTDFFINSMQKNGADLNSLDLERLQLWQRSVQMFREYPAYGVGAGSWQIFFPSFGLNGIWRAEELNFSFQRPHNDFLWVLTESGIVGFNLYLGAFASFLLMELTGFQEISKKEKFRRLLPVSFLVGYLVISCFDFPRERTEHTVYLHLILALICVRSQTFTPRDLQIRPMPLVLAAATGLFLTVVFALRLRGEFHTIALYNLRSVSPPLVIAAGENATSFVYDLDPTTVPIAWYKGTAYAVQGKYPEALRELETAYHQTPFNHRVINDLASAKTITGDTARAKTLYIVAAMISPRYDEPRLNLAALLIHQKRYMEAKKWLSTLTHNSPRRQSYEAIVRINTK